MHTILNITDLEIRSSALKLSARDVARLSGIHWTTWGRALRGAVELRGSNLRKVLAAITAEEQRLLEHLISLHPERARALLAEGGSQGEAGGAGGGTHAARPAGEEAA